MNNPTPRGQRTPLEKLQEKPSEFLIVGIGASAGGIQALQEFFRRVPVDSDMAYIVILHLSPEHDSQLAAVLQHETKIPVSQIVERTVIEPNHIYVVPPDRHLTIEGDDIAVSKNADMEDRRAPVDIFFRTLADQHGPRAISIILSGTGANGSMGLKRVKEWGGAAFVQNPRQAEFNDMPRNAIATELVDEVLNVEEIPARIIAYRDSIGKIQIVEEPEKRPELQQQALREIFTQLRIRTGHDFSNYKRPTLLRRIERRINVHNLPDLPSYANFLQEYPDEVHALLKDLLISVTNFFRDKKAYDYLEMNIIPELFAGKTSADQVRIWVAGCATGEEAYAIAMLCAEHALSTFDAPKVQIFATDIDESAIATAREGFYTVNDAADISPDRLRRFLTRDGDGFRIRREIREMILFANHNFLKDPPFSKLDLITCRNVLIYLNGTAQERVVETFHFALRPKKFLFLGSSESVNGAGDLFAVHNRDHHVYQTREVTPRNYPVPESVPQFQFSKADLLQKAHESESRSQRISFGELHQKMLEQYAPPSVVVNEEYDIVHMSEKAGKYFEFSGGEPTQNLLKLVLPQIRLELRTALFQAVQNKTAVEARNIKLLLNDQLQALDIHVRPALEEGAGTKGFILVIFKPSKEPVLDTETVMLASDEPMARQLEEELVALKTQLRNSIEHHEYQAEELKASNEELQAMNEELRSAAEELETSKEELQSINEELRTVNQELKVKIEETSVTSNNFQNLINSANLGTILLDRSFAIRLFTPAALDVFNLKSGDYGRPVTDITHKLEYSDLLHDAETVLEKLTTIEREVSTTDDRFFMMRLLPYRTAEDRINGVVITFFDITRRRESEEALRQSEERMRLLIESAKDYAIFTIDTERRVVSWSSGAQLIFGYTESEIIGNSGDMVFAPEDREKQIPEEEVENAAKKERAENERWHLRKDGSLFWGSGTTQPVRDENGKIIGFVKIMRDLTEQRQLQDTLRQSEQEYRLQLEKEVELRTAELSASKEQYSTLVGNSPDVITRWDKELRLLFANKAFEKKLGVKIEKLLDKTNGEMGLPEEFVGPYMKSLRKAFETGKTVEHFHSSPTLEGGVYFFSRLTPERNAEGEIETVLAIARDITAMKKAEIDVKRNRDLLQSILDNSFIGMSVLKPVHDEAGAITDFEIRLTNEELNKEIGRSDLVGKLYAKEFPDIRQTGIFDVMLRVMETGQAEGMEYFYPHEAFKKWYSCMFVKMDDGLVATNLNINERKHAEEERNKNYLLLQQSELVASTGTWDYDLATEILSWSDGMYRLFNRRKEMEISPEIYIEYATTECKDTATRITNQIKQGNAEFEETLTLNVGEAQKVINIKARNVKNEQGHPVRVLGVDVDTTASRQAEERLRQMEAEQQLEIFRVTLRTQEEERRRISESLHNGLGQLMYGIQISMNQLRKEKALSEPEKYDQAKSYTEKLVANAIKESRNISHELMPATLEQFGLRSAIDDVCQQLNGKVQFDVRYKDASPRLEKFLELAVFRTVQELMLNVVKHAGATKARVFVEIKPESIHLAVSDNGRGLTESHESKSGIGLSSIRSKIKLLNGTVKITSVPGKGTEVTVDIPVNLRKNESKSDR